jgi:serine phosphatase RsbU (regulator of sigma subunit)
MAMIRIKTFKTQLAIVMISIVVLMLLLNAFLLIQSKRHELQTDIYKNAVRFSNLTVGRIMDAYYRDFKNNSFTAFNSSIKETFTIDRDDIARLQIVLYPTDENNTKTSLIEYDTNTPDNEIASRVEKDQITDPVLLDQIRFQYPSVRLAASHTYYGITPNGYVDAGGNKVENFAGDAQIENIVWPYDNQHSVIYYVSYASLDARTWQAILNMGILTLFAIVASLIVSLWVAHRITDPIKILTHNVLHIARGDFTTKINIKAHNEIGILANTFNKMTDDLAKYQTDLVEKEKMNQEIQLAAEIQQNLLPKQIPTIPGLDIAAGVRPAVAVGGDVYDFIPLHNGDLLFYIGDVTGHGIPASLIASITNTLIFSLQHSSSSPKDIAVAANHVLYSKTKKDMFVTMIIARWDKKLKQLHYTCAGHDQIIVYHAQHRQVSLEPKGGIALGMVKDKDAEKRLENKIITLESGDFLLLYSDGIPEALNSDLKRFSMDRFQRLVEKCGPLATAQEIYDYILDEIQKFMKGQPQADDITLIVLKRQE